MIFEPPAWAGYELDAMRIVVGFVVMRERWLVGARPRMAAPVGIARFVDLRPYVRGPRYRTLRWFFDAAVLIYVAGWYLWLSSTVAAVIAIVWLTASVSDAVVNHGRHLGALALVSTALGNIVWETADALDLDLGRLVLSTAETTGAWWTVQAIVASYFVSGVAKLGYTRFMWIWRSPGLVLHILVRVGTAESETAHPDAALRRSATIARFLSRHPWPARVFFGAGLLVELLIPLALINRTTLIIGGVALIVLHMMNGLVLRLWFRSYQWLVLVYMVHLPWLVVEALEALGLT